MTLKDVTDKGSARYVVLHHEKPEERKNAFLQA